MMTTEYVVVHESATVEGAIEALRNFEGQVEAIQQIYMIDNEAALKGAVAIGRIVLAAANSPPGGAFHGGPDFGAGGAECKIGGGSLS